MSNAHYVLLFVDSPRRSAAFYRDLLGLEPVEEQATFALFVLDSGLRLGLWSKHTAEPLSSALPGGMEVGFEVPDKAAVEKCYAEWTAKDARVLQKPVDLDFGHTFVVLDLDGHRLRVFAAAP